MELITISIFGVAAGLVAIFGTVLSRLLTDEAKAWIPWLTDRLIRRAIQRLPGEQRERYAEEWRSHIAEIPGDLGKLLVASQLLFAARRMSSNKRWNWRAEFARFRFATVFWIGLILTAWFMTGRVEHDTKLVRSTVSHVKNSIEKQAALINGLQSQLSENASR